MRQDEKNPLNILQRVDIKGYIMITGGSRHALKCWRSGERRSDRISTSPSFIGLKKRSILRISNNFMITRIVLLTVLILGISRVGFYVVGIIPEFRSIFTVLSIWKGLEWRLVKDWKWRDIWTYKSQYAWVESIEYCLLQKRVNLNEFILSHQNRAPADKDHSYGTDLLSARSYEAALSIVQYNTRKES